MRDNPVKTTLSAGGLAFGTMIFEFASPGLPQILRNAGADFAFFDMEHSGFDMATIKTQLALCRGLGLTPLVRPPDKSYQHTTRILDLGAMGLLFPMVESAEEAEALVRWTRYPPTGVRGAMFGGAHDDYGSESISSVMSQAHERTLICALIETEKGLANVEEIVAVPGIDVAHLGHADLSLSLGIPGEFEHPQMQEGIQRIAGACKKHGKTPACLVGSVEQGKEWIAKGFRMVSYFYDIAIFTESLRRGIEGMKS